MLTENYLYRIYSFDFQDDGFVENLVIQDVGTRATRKAKIEGLLADMEMLAHFRPQDIVTIAYMAGQQEVLKERAWLASVQKGVA